MPLSPEIQRYNDILVERIVPFHHASREQIVGLLNKLSDIMPDVDTVDDLIGTYRQFLVLANPAAAGDLVAQSMAEALGENTAELSRAATAWRVRNLARRVSEDASGEFTQETAQQLMHTFIDQLVEFSLQNEGIDILEDTRNWLDDAFGDENQVGE